MRELPEWNSALWRRLWQGFIADLRWIILVVAVLGLVVAACKTSVIRHWLSISDVTVTLALLSVAVGAMGAISCGVVGRLNQSARGQWLCMGLIVYSVVGIPAATLLANSDVAVNSEVSVVALGNIRLLAHVMLLTLTFAAVFLSAPPHWGGWTALYVVLVTVGAGFGLGAAFPAASLSITTDQGVRAAVTVAWVSSAALLIAASWLHGRRWLFWVGLGSSVVAVAHVFRVAAGSPLEPLGLSFSTVRLVGLLLILVGAASAGHRALRSVQDAHASYQEEIRLAKIDLQQVERRAHDVRNGLAGLAGVTRLLESDLEDREEMASLRRAAAGELRRLDALLCPVGPEGDAEAFGEYDVGTILHTHVALRHSSGMDVRMDVEPGLRTTGRSAVLAQVMTNVLANCAQHAPGSPVRVRARAVRGLIEIRIRDFGPGVPPGAEAAVFEVGVRRSSSPGQGLGLDICRRLLAAERGRIEIRSQNSGCTVVIELSDAMTPDKPRTARGPLVSGSENGKAQVGTAQFGIGDR